MRIKIIDLPDYETDPIIIADHLKEVLKTIRKNKLARDLIGEDERSSEFEVGEFDEFAEVLSSGIDLTMFDKRRIAERASKLAKTRVRAAGVSHLKREEYDRLKPGLHGMSAVMPRGEDWVDEVAAALHEEMPWMAPATEYAWHEFRLAAKRGNPITIRPVILNGPPGIGKSVWARAVAEALHLPMAEIDASKGGAGMALVGLERGWGTAQAGRPIDLMLAKTVANPMIIVDEICKATSRTSTRGPTYSFADALLSLLEPATARAWDCPYFRVTFDLSHLSWILTANNVDLVSEPVRSRCAVIEIPDVTEAQLLSFATRRAAKLGLSDEARDAVLDAIVLAPAATGRRLCLRDVVRMLTRAEMLEGRAPLH